jgi:class 3 adenylate cyclase
MAATETRTILEIDLISYSDIALALEESLSVQAVSELQEQIQGFISQGLREVGLERNDVVFDTAGDSAILVFEEPDPMHRVASAISAATFDHNGSKTVANAERWFRMGSATGTVLLDRSKAKVVGSAVARAVRLEAASDWRSLLVDVPTFEALPSETQGQFGPQITVSGKRTERFAARRTALIEDRGEREASSPDLFGTSALSDVWNLLDANLQDAFAIAYNKKTRERSERPTRISTRDLFQALERIDDPSLKRILGSLPSEALPEPSELVLTNELDLLNEIHLLSDCIEESLGAFSGAAREERKVTPSDIFVDISKNGHGASVDLLRQSGIGPGEIESQVESLGLDVLQPR